MDGRMDGWTMPRSNEHHLVFMGVASIDLGVAALLGGGTSLMLLMIL
jgi:hypothetical protein